MEMKDFLPEIKMRGNCCHAAPTENSFQPYIYLSRRRVSPCCLLFLQLSNCQAIFHLVFFFSPPPRTLLLHFFQLSLVYFPNSSACPIGGYIPNACPAVGKYTQHKHSLSPHLAQSLRRKGKRRRKEGSGVEMKACV